MVTVGRWVYGIFGAVAIGLGVLVLVRPGLALPAEAYSPLTAHLIREQGAEGVFLGLMALWCSFNLAERFARISTPSCTTSDALKLS